MKPSSTARANDRGAEAAEGASKKRGTQEQLRKLSTRITELGVLIADGKSTDVPQLEALLMEYIGTAGVGDRFVIAELKFPADWSSSVVGSFTVAEVRPVTRNGARYLATDFSLDFDGDLTVTIAPCSECSRLKKED